MSTFKFPSYAWVGCTIRLYLDHFEDVINYTYNHSTYLKPPYLSVSCVLNNLIFFMFIRFPAILLVKTIDSYLHEFCARVFYKAIFSNMVQRQRARYKNNVTTATLESKKKNA